MHVDGTDPPANPSPEAADGPIDFRWQALFQRAGDAVFVLNRSRRILFVNRAWEQMTGLTSAEARGLRCRPSALPAVAPLDLRVRVVCAPPPEVVAGKAGRVRRLWSKDAAQPVWWEIDYLPMTGTDASLAFLGRLRPISEPAGPNPEGAAASWQEIRPNRAGFESLASAVPAMGVVVRQARLAAGADVPFLVVGEAGSGKRWLAGVIHHASPRSHRPLIALACARLPLEQCRALLAAHNALRMGWQGGTLFLQEPQALPLDLQRGLVERMQTESSSTTLRVAAGMRLEPAEAIRKGLLLPELAYLLETLVVRLPPLRERREDLVDLLDSFWKRIRSAFKREDAILARETREMLLRYNWPANLHELQSVLTSAAQRAGGKQVEPGDLPSALRLQMKLEESSTPLAAKPPPLDVLLEQVERRMLTTALRKAGGNKSKAAEWLGIWRARLIRRLDALGLGKDEESPPVVARPPDHSVVARSPDRATDRKGQSP
ncbi:MAG TPA: sigma 54-interacting transcriptional regulator [Gemmataceae bacterium]|nr:sigma 54-interacting transcriptional regulator [Gemmataceae bacterium]